MPASERTSEFEEGSLRGLQAMTMSASQATVVVVMLRLVGVVCQAAMIALLAHILSLEAMGSYAAIYVFWGLVRMLAPLGLDQVALREIAVARAHRESALAGAITWHAGLLTACFSLGIALAAGLVLAALATTARLVLRPLELWSLLLAIPAFALVSILGSLVRGHDRNIASQAVETIGLHLVTLAALLLHWRFADLDLGAALAWQASFAWVTALAYMIMLREPAGRNAGGVPVELARRLWLEGLEVWQALVLISLAVRAPVYLCLVLLGPAATAILEVATRFGTLPTIFTSAVSTTVGPTMASQWAKQDRVGLADTVAVASWLGFLPPVSILLGVAVMGPWLLSTFFPPAYQQAYVPLLIITAATTVSGAFGMSSTLLFMTGRQRVVRAFSLAKLAAVLLSGVAFGLLFGVNGIAVSMLTGALVFDAGLATQTRRHLNVTGILRRDGLASAARTLRGAADHAERSR